MDKTEHWQQASNFFDQLLDTDGQLLQQRLDQSGLSAPVKALVQRMLNAHQHTHSTTTQQSRAMIQQMMVSASLEEDVSVEDWIGHEVGAWRIIQHLAEGGMAQVFLAERTDGHFDKQVALKLIRSNRLSALTRQQFQQEMQLLAQLEAPGIARLIDAGMLEQGQPWLVMEYVEGQALNDYCRQHKLDLRQRMGLFIQLLDAVQAVHERFIVHSDIKPSNVLVTESGQVKLLDFGISRWLEADGDQSEHRAFTPYYASPEQLSGQNLTLASDIYSLGVVLFELVTAQTFPASLDRNQQTPDVPAGVARELRAVLMQALQPLPQNRYRNALAFRQDIENWLDNRPVQAMNGTPWYRMGKFISRYRWLNLAYILVVVSLLAGVIATQKQVKVAQAEAERANAMESFASDMILAIDPWQNQREPVTANQLVLDAVASMPEKLSQYPEQRAEALLVLGQMLQRLSLDEQANSINAEAYQAFRDLDDERWRQALNAWALSRINSHQFEGLEEMLLKALETSPLPPQDGLAVELRLRLAEMYIYLNRYQAISAITERLLQHETRILQWDEGVELMGSIWAVHSEGLERLGQFKAAIEAAEQSLMYFRRIYPENHARIATALGHISTASYELGDLEQAEASIRATLSIFQSVYGPAHGETMWAQYQLGRTLIERHAVDEGIAHFLQFRKVVAEYYGDEHPHLALVDANLSQLYRHSAAYDLAQQFMQQAYDLHKRLFPDNHKTFVMKATLARLASEQGNWQQADQDYRQALQAFRAGEGLESPAALKPRLGYLRHLLRSGQIKTAVDEAEALCPVMQTVYGDQSPMHDQCTMLQQVAYHISHSDQADPQRFEQARTRLEQTPVPQKYQKNIEEALAWIKSS